MQEIRNGVLYKQQIMVAISHNTFAVKPANIPHACVRSLRTISIDELFIVMERLVFYSLQPYAQKSIIWATNDFRGANKQKQICF